jgi:hypothetical protein
MSDKFKTLTSAQHIDISRPVSDMALTVTDNRTDVKPYFDTLPRELRDCIYDLLYQEIEESRGSSFGDLEFYTRAVIPRLRFVSRQFKAEYDERISANDFNQQLTVTDTLSLLQCPFKYHKILFSPLSSHTTKLTINMVNGWHCTPIISTIAYSGSTTNWLDNLTRQLPNVRQIRLRVCVPMATSTTMTLSLTNCTGEKLPTLNELQVLSWDDITYTARPLGTWSKEGGMQRHEDAIAKHEARQKRINEIVREERSRE